MTQTVFNSLNHIYYILSFSGFLSFQYNNQTKEIKTRKFFNIFIITIVLSVLSLMFYKMNFTGIEYEKNRFLNILTIFYNDSLFFKMFSVILCSQLYRSEILEAWKALTILDEEVQKVGVEMKYTRIKYIPYGVLIFQVFSKLMVQIILTCDYFSDYGSYAYAIFAIYLISDLVINVMRLSYMTLETIFANYYLELDKILKKTFFMNRSLPSSCDRIKIQRMYFLDKDQRIHSMVKDQRKHSFIIDTVANPNFHKDSDLVKLACKLHLELSKICKTYSSVFTPILIAIYADSFFLCTVHLYNIISKTYDSRNTAEWDISTWHSCYWFFECVYTLGTFVVPAWYCFRNVSNNKVIN